MYKIYVNEGVKGLQKGLTPAILREASKNFFRIVSLCGGRFDYQRCVTVGIIGNVRPSNGNTTRPLKRQCTPMETHARRLNLWSNGSRIRQPFRTC